ncbi:hypothetical protein Nepgr_011679 [Nepenthes gracilis]|uniref:Uncharacterized protein n=1 Tax=Nepenthes gracilis TaxID=150966 RepID=A0AAD3XM53_NEPGR|nr:hypothetical protein Nepgr_011679 [Nepenthes gracilis]
MGRAPCCDKANVKKGPWSPEEDAKLKEYIGKFGTGGNWIALPQKAGLKRCGKSCRLRWLNYLRPNIKHGEFSDEEDKIICQLFANIGSRWSIIAAQLPGRTDNDIKNYWNTKLKKKLIGMANHPHHKITHQAPSTYRPVLQTSLSPLSSPVLSASSPYHCSPNALYNTPSALSFSGFDHQTITNPFSPLANSSKILHSSSILQCTHDGHLSSMQSYLMFGGAEASCSSSDGSCSNQISHSRDMEYEYGSAPNGEKKGIMQKFCNFYNNALEENKKNMLSNGGGGDEFAGKPHINDVGFWEDARLDYELEEIKKLISSSYNNVSSDFFLDENKTAEQRAMYYGC